jgi:hypothetical protein
MYMEVRSRGSFDLTRPLTTLPAIPAWMGFINVRANKVKGYVVATLWSLRKAKWMAG